MNPKILTLISVRIFQLAKPYGGRKPNHLKLSTFAEEYFRRIAAATATPMLLRKGLLHELVDICDPEEMNGDVKAKLDALHKLLS